LMGDTILGTFITIQFRIGRLMQHGMYSVYPTNLPILNPQSSSNRYSMINWVVIWMQLALWSI